MPVLKVIGADSAARWLVGTGVKVQVGIRPLVNHYGQVYQARVRARASGRPGPRVVTGDYRRSIGLRLGGVEGVPSAVVGTDAPQARRLEYGFVGTDSLGRSYSQAPLPHWEPDLERTADELEKAVEALILSAGTDVRYTGGGPNLSQAG